MTPRSAPRRAPTWQAALVGLIAGAVGAWSALPPVHAQVPTGPGATGTAFLAGRVLDSTGHGVSGATVLLGRGRATGSTVLLSGPLARGGPNAPVSTDSQGRFYFADLPAGAYALIANKPGYVQANVATRVMALADGERFTDARLHLIELGSLSGTVRDDGGDAVVGTTVVALRHTVVNGQPMLTAEGRSQSDDRGGFHVDNLRPGPYVVCACLHDAIPLDGQMLTSLAANPVQLLNVAARAATLGGQAVVLDPGLRTAPPMFFPSSPTAERAEPVAVDPGRDHAGVDIVVSPVRATHVSGTVTGASSAVFASELRLVPAGENLQGEGEDALMALSPVLVLPDGRFDFTTVPPGEYVLRVSHLDTSVKSGNASGEALEFLGARGAAMDMASRQAQAQGGAREYATLPVTVGEGDVTGLVVPLQHGAALRGRVAFSGSHPPPVVQPGRGDLAVFAIRPVGGLPATPAPPLAGRVAADGSFESPALAPGRYALQVPGPAGWPTPASVVINGVDVLDLAFEVGLADLSDAVITWRDTPSPTVTGTLAGGAPASGEDLTVLLFPADRRYWADPVASARRFRTAAIDRKGAFTVGALPSGQYLAVVVPDEEATEWQQKATLEALARRAVPVDLVDGQAKTLEVRK